MENIINRAERRIHDIEMYANVHAEEWGDPLEITVLVSGEEYDMHKIILVAIGDHYVAQYCGDDSDCHEVEDLDLFSLRVSELAALVDEEATATLFVNNSRYTIKL